MSKLTINHVRIAGLSACVPSKVEENIGLPIFKDTKEAEKVINSTGIIRRHIAEEGVTSSDLAVKAVEKLLEDLHWEKDSIDCLAFVSQTRDFIAPQTSCILQDRLGLSNKCFVMDLPFGCSGFVHGISVVAALLQNGNLKRALMINAETNSKNRNKNDRSVRPLFGDAATVTALEYSPTAKPINFVFGVDGSGYQAIWTKYGGMRFPTTPESLQEEELEPGVIRKGTDMIVNGMDVFAFAISRPPKSIKELIETFSIDMDTIDYLVLHQANKFIDEKIRKALKVDSSKVPYSLDEYGNVTSASIPLTLVARCQKELTTRTNHCIASGFGIGLAWASMELYIEHAVCSDIVVY